MFPLIPVQFRPSTDEEAIIRELQQRIALELENSTFDVDDSEDFDVDDSEDSSSIESNLHNLIQHTTVGLSINIYGNLYGGFNTRRYTLAHGLYFF